MNIYGVIMAGGGGTRFWPLSREERPKQLLNLSGKNLMINETIDRVASVIPKKDIFIVTNSVQFEAMKQATNGRIEEKHILKEPVGRNTSACIGYAAMEIVKKYGDGIMCIFPADHHIKDEIEFSRILQEAIKVAESDDRLVTMGITPTFAATGYGYIKYMQSEAVAKEVVEFKEKPDSDTAKKYFESGEYAWNSGMFIWRTSTILKKFKELLPEIYNCIEQMGIAMKTDSEYDVIEEIYPKMPSISIDYGIMEKSKDVVVIPADIGWSDVGSFDSLGSVCSEDEKHNIIFGSSINLDTKNSVIYGGDKLIATIGINNLVIINSENAILVCDKNNSQDVKKIVDILKEQGKDEYL